MRVELTPAQYDSRGLADRQRAKESHIEFVSGAQLKDLKGVISRLWLSARPT